MELKEAFERSRLPYRKIGREVGMSPAALCRLANYGEYPTRRDANKVKQSISAVLERHGISARAIAWPKPGVRPNYGDGARREATLGVSLERHQSYELTKQEELELMQLDREVLNIFGLRANPFLNDVETDDDVFPHRGHDQVMTAIRETIDQRGLLAVLGPSGAGKTTIWDGIEAEYANREDTVICKPQVKSKEQITPEHLARALLFGLLGDNARIQRESESRGRQLSAALRALRNPSLGDRRAILYIDDAHYCSASVLRQLKTFYEEKVGRYRLLAIVLVGVTHELKPKLGAFPEIGNRIRIVEVPPVPVQEYLQFKLKRVGSAVERLFDTAGLNAFLDRFRQPRRAPLGYPLIINATCIHAMVKLHQGGAQPGDRITQGIIDMLPGGGPLRKIA
jgi:type II secretory pathway predicted ATPase ExeA